MTIMPTELSIFSSVELFGERFGVIELSDGDLTIPDGLMFPDTALRQHYFVRVVAKGDGRWRSADLPPRVSPDVEVGDIIMVQMNPQLTTAYMVGPKPMVVMHWGDALAKVTDASVPLSIHTVKPVGKWVFADIRKLTKADNLFLPDDSVAAATTTTLVSAGTQSGIDHPPGTRIYVDMTKTSHFSLGNWQELRLEPAKEGDAINRKLVYVNCDYVLGTVGD